MFLLLIYIIILLLIIIYLGEKIMSAIENLNQAVVDLQAIIGALVVPVNNDAAIQAAADSIAAANAALKAKVV
jgi:RES domain-containing protein